MISLKSLLITLLLANSIRAEFDDWHEDYFAPEIEVEVEHTRPQRNDNIYVKGFYGYGYSTQRYSHLDCICNELDESDRDLGQHIEDYCNAIAE